MKNKIYNDQGFLTLEGQQIFSELLDQPVMKILNHCQSEQEVRTLGALLSKRIGDLVSYRITK